MPPEKPCPSRERKSVRMMPDNVALFATIILLLPMIYFLLASPAFLLVRLDIPAVALLLRAMFSGYFLAVAHRRCNRGDGCCRRWPPRFGHCHWLRRGFGDL